MLTFEELYLAYSPDVYRFACWLTGNATEAEDITSDTFFRAWMNFKTIRMETLRPYLFTIARNMYLESRRKTNNHRPVAESFAEHGSSVEQIIERKGELDAARHLLLHLPEIDRSAFVLRVQHDLPYAEIARILGVSEASVKVKVHRVRKKLFEDYRERNSYE
ncbi:MAG TPA: RNA polymerase sigma factor [Anaerolineales bacterium]|nr:RNA polymerase sigma factor [Anaerolineales bacterium]